MPWLIAQNKDGTYSINRITLLEHVDSPKKEDLDNLPEYSTGVGQQQEGVVTDDKMRVL